MAASAIFSSTTHQKAENVMSKRIYRFLLATVLLLQVIPGATASAQRQTNPDTPHTNQLYLPLLVNDAQPPAPTRGRGLSTPQLIEQAYQNGEITAEERLLYLAYALYEQASLPDRFHSNVGWYGTYYVREVQTYVQQMSAAATTAVQQELGRMGVLAATVCDKNDGPNNFNSTNFHFNYNTISGGLALADYVTSMEATFDLEVTQYGWAEPPLCTGGDTCNGTDNPFDRYPIQIFAIGSGLYGYVSGGGGGSYAGFIGDNPNTSATETDALSSCMVLNDDFSQFPEGAQGALDATTGHEFVHAIQNGYGDPDTREDSMWYESSAAYMEDEVFDASNSNYFYLWPVVTNSLGAWPNNDDPGGISQYSNFLFFRHVAEHNGGTNTAGGGEEIMQHFWENVAAGQAGLVAYNNALVTAGTTLADAFHAYAIAAKYSKACGGTYAAPYCFEEAAGYINIAGNPPAVQGTIAAKPGSYNGKVRNHYAINWVSLPTSGSPYQVTLSNTDTGGQLRGSLVCDTGSTFVITPFSSVVGAGTATSIASFNAAGCTTVTAVITNQQQTSGNPSSAPQHDYTLSVSNAAATPTATVTPTTTPGNTPTSTATATPTTPGNTPTNTATATPTVPVNTPTSTATATSTTPGNTPTNTATATPTVPVNTPTSTATATPTTPGNTPTSTATATVTSTPLASSELVYVSSSTNAKVDGLSFRDEDILVYNQANDQWDMVFDGSDVGVGNADLDGFAILDDGTILMSFDVPINFPAIGLVDDSDIVKFTPTQLGPNTSGSFTLFFDGSDVGLTTGSEDIDALAYTADGKLLISTYGTATVDGVRALDEDLLRFTPTSLGATTAGTWELFFDGSAVGLTTSSEDVTASLLRETNSLYLVTKGKFAASSQNAIAGDGDDIFGCALSASGLNNTQCTFFSIFDGDLVRFNRPIDGFSLGEEERFLMRNTGSDRGDEPAQFEVLPDDLVTDDPEFDSFDLEQLELNTYLPFVIR